MTTKKIVAICCFVEPSEDDENLPLVSRMPVEVGPGGGEDGDAAVGGAKRRVPMTTSRQVPGSRLTQICRDAGIRTLPATCCRPGRGAGTRGTGGSRCVCRNTITQSALQIFFVC